MRVHAGLVLNGEMGFDFEMQSEKGGKKANKNNHKEPSMVSNTSMAFKSWEMIPLSEMRNVFDLLETFYEVNTEVIRRGRNGSSIFREFTEVTGKILELFNNLHIEIDDINKITLQTMPELESYNFCFDPLPLSTFFKLCTLLITKHNCLPTQKKSIPGIHIGTDLRIFL